MLRFVGHSYPQGMSVSVTSITPPPTIASTAIVLGFVRDGVLIW